MAKVADRADVLKGRYCRQQIARPELKHKRGLLINVVSAGVKTQNEMIGAAR